MLILPIEEATPGVALALGIPNPQNPEQQLLKAGFVLDENIIARLKELGVPFVYVAYPDLADLDKLLLPNLSPARQQMYLQIKNTVAAVERTAQPTVTFPDYYASTRELVITLLQQGHHPIYMDLMSARLHRDDVAHSAAVAHLSLMLGIRLEQYLISQRKRLDPQHAREVVNLGVAGMLHDIGKARLDKRLRNYSAIHMPDDPIEQEEWQSHVRIGYEMIRSGVEPSAAAAVLHHHQSFDGTGFPAVLQQEKGLAPLEGTSIHVFARIVAAADLYERLTVTPDGDVRPNIEILHIMRSQYAARIDPQILKVMASVIPPFPPGMKVKLSDGTAAVVVNFCPSDPYRPVVQRLASDNWTLDGEPIDLGEATHLSVAQIDGVSTEGMIPSPEPVAAKGAASQEVVEAA